MHVEQSEPLGPPLRPLLGMYEVGHGFDIGRDQRYHHALGDRHPLAAPRGGYLAGGLSGCVVDGFIP